MTEIEGDKLILTGPKGRIPLQGDDEILRKLSMLFEGECEGRGVSAASAKFGYSRQRYYQLLDKLRKEGVFALKSKKTGPGSNAYSGEKCHRSGNKLPLSHSSKSLINKYQSGNFKSIVS